MTRKLYYEDAYLARFTATVLACREEKGSYSVILDATAFFPEGGGQAWDTGVLDGISVTEVHLVGDEILHLCSAPLPVGKTVEGQIDWPQRFARMQAHTGEHILSGTVHTLTGYDNVGFHMGADCLTVDFSGKLTEEELAAIQRRGNRAVWENRKVRAWFPEEEARSSLPYRSKKDIDGDLRLVEIEGIDLCACCAPHVKLTGEVGPIVILGKESFHGGTRLSVLCGEAAMEHLLTVQEENKGISALLSVKSHETRSAVARMAEELGATKFRLGQMEKALYAALAEGARGQKSALLFRKNGDAGKLACALSETVQGPCGVFVQSSAGYRFALCRKEGDITPLYQRLQEVLGGKGGGSSSLVQGSLMAKQDEIEAFWKESVHGPEGK